VVIVNTHPVPFFAYPHIFASQQEAFSHISMDVGCHGALIMQLDYEI
jgi:hypothetical protein